PAASAGHRAAPDVSCSVAGRHTPGSASRSRGCGCASPLSCLLTSRHARVRKEESSMPRYLLQAAYTPQAWAAMTRNPENRAQGLGHLVETLGGRLLSLDYCFGEY